MRTDEDSIRTVSRLPPENLEPAIHNLVRDAVVVRDHNPFLAMHHTFRWRRAGADIQMGVRPAVDRCVARGLVRRTTARELRPGRRRDPPAPERTGESLPFTYCGDKRFLSRRTRSDERDHRCVRPVLRPRSCRLRLPRVASARPSRQQRWHSPGRRLPDGAWRLRALQRSGVYFVGLASGSQGLGGRLQNHTADSHGAGWSRFSWFAFDMPSDDETDDDGVLQMERGVELRGGGPSHHP